MLKPSGEALPIRSIHVTSGYLLTLAPPYDCLALFRLHATCSSLHPGVTPLPGVDIWVMRNRSVLVDQPEAASAPHEQQEGILQAMGEDDAADALTGYFQAALAAAGKTGVCAGC